MTSVQMTWSFGLPAIVAGVMMVALNAYVLLGGADFGGGVWDLLASGPRRDEQRKLISSAIGPIWEANHVWLIVVVVVLFTGFPGAFGTLSIILHIPLALMLVGIVLRGSAFVFRSYGARGYESQQRWGRVFAIASVITPVLLGVCVGAIASGAVGRAAHPVGPTYEWRVPTFTDTYVRPWLAPFPIAVGAMALALFAFLAAVYLIIAARSDELKEDFRRRAIGAGVAVFVCAFVALALSMRHAPEVGQRLTSSGWAAPFHVVTAIAAIIALWALWTRRYRLARLAAAAQVSLVLWGWAFGQYPWMVPGHVSIEAAAAPPITLELLLWGLAGGSLILIPSLWYLYRTFARENEASGVGR